MKYKVHIARFVEYVPQAVHCLAFEDLEEPTRVAVSRADGSIEIWNLKDDWYQELIIPGCNGTSVEALDWCRDRLFSAGLHAEITEWDLNTLKPKVSIDSFGGAVWCLAANHAKTHLAAGCEDGCVRLFDITSQGLSYDKSLSQEESRVLSLGWHKSDNWLVTGGSDSTVRVYSVNSEPPHEVSLYFQRIFSLETGDTLSLQKLPDAPLTTNCHDSPDHFTPASGKQELYSGSGVYISCVELHTILAKSIGKPQELLGQLVTYFFKDETLAKSVPLQESRAKHNKNVLDQRIVHAIIGRCTLRITTDEFHTRSTLIWAVHITSNFVVITGDSLGNTQFWDGKHGTLLQSFRAHSADVLAVCVNQDENMVFSGGVDSKLVQFQLIASEDGVSRWVRGGSLRNFSQDVRTLAFLRGNSLVSAGLDTSVTVHPIKTFGMANSYTNRIRPFPHSPIVFFALEANILMYQMSGGLQFWRLGETGDGESTTVEKPPAQLLRINKKGDHHITCSAISPCAGWVAFSDPYRISLFRLNLITTEPSNVTVSKVSSLPNDLLPALKLLFTSDSSKLICGGSLGTIQVLDLSNEPVLCHTFNIPGGSNPAVQLLTASSDNHWLACADRSNTVNLFNLKKMKFHNPLPKLESRLTAMAFQPKTNHLAVVCCNHQICIFKTKSGKLTEWSREASAHGLPKQWLERDRKAINIQFSPSCHEVMLLQDSEMITLLDLREPLPDKHVVLYEPISKMRKRKHNASNEQTLVDGQQQALRVCRKYWPLLYAGFTRDTSLVVVERPWHSILESLPPTLERKKYAT